MGRKVIVVDDDEIVGNLSLDLLLNAGFDAELIQDSLSAAETIKARRPELVVLDIMMPGLDGLTLCRNLRADPELADLKIVMVSGKSYQEDRERAIKYGANLFLKKPYDLMGFAKAINSILENGPAHPSSEGGPESGPGEFAPVPDPKIQFEVWGCRSLSPHTQPVRSTYGYETSCVSVEIGGRLLIFDAGSGLKALGERIVKEGRFKEAWLFLTHFHRDHVSGLGLFAPLGMAGFQLNITGARDPDRSLEESVKDAILGAPGSNEEILADIELFEVREEPYEPIPGIKMTPFYSNHPGRTLGFLVEAEGRRFAYCPDSELYGEGASALQDYDERLGKIVGGVDFLIHDGRYTEEDYASRKNNGHSSWAVTVDFAARTGVKRLLLFHHDDEHDDQVLDAVRAEAQRRVESKGSALECRLARTGFKASL